MNKKADIEVKSNLTRIAIVNADRCKPKNCGQPCKKGCPVVKQGKQCIVVEPTSKIAEISEILCIGCGICVKKCPYGAISIINLPSNLERDTTHRYSANSFKLHRLPTPRLGSVLGLVGTNGIGKSTALKILANKLKPNLGQFKVTPAWPAILKHFQGSELQKYFTKILEEKFKAIIKPQYVDQIPHALKKTALVRDMLVQKCDRDNLEQIIDDLELRKLLDRNVNELSGGELQRFAIAMCAVQEADITSSRVIRGLIKDSNYILVVEHDLAVLDYLSDFVCCLYGVPGAYGVVTMPFGVREGINVFLDGFVPTENMRFRDSSLSFKVVEQLEKEEEVQRHSRYSYPKMTKTLKDFQLSVEMGEFSDSEIIVLLGENGTGKTTLIRMLAGNLKPDEDDVEVPELSISYKPQKIAPKYDGTVINLLLEKIPDMVRHPTFKTDVLNPLQMDRLMDLEVKNLSGGELQRVALTMCLGKPANVYLIDEPSAYLDSEQRLHAAKVIKRHILHSKKTAFIVEHDFMMSTYLADRAQSLLDGMNQFLRQLNITFRRDNESHRPRINKADSVKDSEQKKSGNYFFLEDS
uniref:ATP-binding cassette sub-family E member 1 n=1 Tax=Ditylenchus dipsaci TaxID=166011 RepID=A0A915EK59_9BILA